MKKIRNFFIGVLLIISLYFVVPSHKEDMCDSQKEFNKKEIFGLVVRKFYDHSNHSVPLIILRNFKNKSIDTLDFFGDTSSVFKKVAEDDTILKKINTSLIFLKVNQSFIKIGNVDFGCKNK